MSEYTGKLFIDGRSVNGYHIKQETPTHPLGYFICDIKDHNLAQEFCALHNTAISINPSNPMAVAEGMEAFIKTLQKDIELGYGFSVTDMKKLLAKITGGK